MYGYIYKTTNLINEKIYVGQKHSDKFLGNIYLGSGKRLLSAIKHYGKENFEVQLIECVETKEEMDEREIYWIKYFDATNKDIGYNISLGGNVNRTMVGENNPFFGKHHTEESKQKMSSNNKKTMLGKHHTEETKQKISIGNKGKKMSDESKKKLSDNAKTNDNYGMKGKQVSNQTKEKISQAKRGVPSKAKGKIHITNDIEDKMIKWEELQSYLDLGWRRGRKKFSQQSRINMSNSHVGLQTHNKGKIAISKDGKKKFIYQDELQLYTKDGWQQLCDK